MKAISNLTLYVLPAAPRLRFTSATEAILFAMLAGIDSAWQVCK